MANRTFQDVQAVHREVKIFSCAALCGSGSTVTLFQGDPTPASGTTPGAIGATASFSSAVLTIDLTDNYNALLSAFAQIKDPAGSGSASQLLSVSETVASNGQVALTFDSALTEDDEVYVTLFLKNTSVER